MHTINVGQCVYVAKVDLDGVCVEHAIVLRVGPKEVMLDSALSSFGFRRRVPIPECSITVEDALRAALEKEKGKERDFLKSIEEVRENMSKIENMLRPRPASGSRE